MKPIKAAQRQRKSRTLQEKYEARLLTQREAGQLKEVLEAAQYANMILEALDETELKRATFTLKKLKGIKDASKSVPTLAAACSEAIADVNEFMGGGIMGLIKKGVSAIASKFGIKVGENPILGSLTLLNALEAGGEALPDLIQNNVDKYDDKSDKSPLEQADEAGKKNMAKAFRKALVPEGVFSKIASLFKAGSIPYVSDIDGMVLEILKLKPAEITEFVNAIRIGPDTGDAEEAAIAIVDQSKSAKKGGGGGGAATEVPSKGEAVSGAKQLAVTIAAGNAAEKGETGEKADAAVEAAKEDPSGTTNKFIDFVANKSKQDPAVVKNVVSAMLKSQMLSANFEIKESVSRRRRTAELTGFDILRARQCLRECNGSTSRWVDLLFLSEGMLLAEDKVSQLNSAVANNIDKVNDIDQLVAVVKDKFKDLSDEEKKKLLDKLGGNNKLTKKLKVNSDDLKKSLSQKLSSGGGEAKKAEPPAPEKALKLFKDQKIDLKDPKGRLDAVKTLKSQYDMDAKEASAFIKDKVQPLADQGAGGGEKKHPLDKVTDKIAAAKSFDDIASLFKKMKPEKVIIGQLNGKDVNLTDQIRNLEAMAKDPEAIKNINAFTRKGGLRNKVKELLAAGKKKGEEGKGGSRSDKVVDQLKDQLKDVKPEQIKAVVDAIPEFLFKAA